MISPLGENFPEEYRRKFCQDHLKPAAVLRFQSFQTSPPKIKRCVVIALDDESESLALTFINSGKPSNPYLQPWQLLLECAGRGYLDHDSYLDCAQLYEESFVAVSRMLIRDVDVYLGRMSDGDFEKAKRLVLSAKSIPSKLKKKYGLL
jgi:hypothetical protein